MKRAGSWAAIAVAVVAVVGTLSVSVGDWTSVGDSGISLTGWIALVLGFLIAMALGVGLMALVFISNRKGYDDPSGPDH